jgi:alpha-mannosidase
LICNAHLDPVWQWRWEEGAAEAMATFRNAAALLREHKDFIFNHNEAILYRWVEKYDPALFREIQALVREGRWSVAGGWYLQPDVNMPGLESLVRQIVEGRRYFRERFRARPRVAYNFDSFGHGGGLPQILNLAGYKMYIYMRTQKEELGLPADLFRWRGVDGSEVLALRIETGLYHSERDNIEEKIGEGVELALRLKRDVPVFWGLGDNGGGATREALAAIDACLARERRVEIIHSTPDRLFEALRAEGRKAPVVEGDLQRVFTGCYTSLSRIKRKAEESLAALLQTETLCAASWWLAGDIFPGKELSEAWRDQLLNDFHDILSGSCTEPAEKDALDLYGKVLETARRLRLGAASALNRSLAAGGNAQVPVTILNSNPALTEVPVEVECLADYRPFWKGEWHLRVFGRDGREVLSQEEQPESLLPFNWRKKLCFMAEVPGVGVSHYEVKVFSGKRSAGRGRPGSPQLTYRIDRKKGLLASLRARATKPLLRGPLFEPIIIKDEGDSWGTGRFEYRDIVARLRLEPGSLKVVENGPVRTITESVLAYKKSRIVFHTIAYPAWPVNSVSASTGMKRGHAGSPPTTFAAAGSLRSFRRAIHRPADGQEHVFGAGRSSRKKKTEPAALAVIGSGQHGLDFRDGELRISVLRSAAYCHERGFKLRRFPARKLMDQGVHEIRFLITAGEAGGPPLRGLARRLAQRSALCSGPSPLGETRVGVCEGEKDDAGGKRAGSGDIPDERPVSLLALDPQNIRLIAARHPMMGTRVLRLT